VAVVAAEQQAAEAEQQVAAAERWQQSCEQIEQQSCGGSSRIEQQSSGGSRANSGRRAELIEFNVSKIFM
jgi:hypothetical protein